MSFIKTAKHRKFEYQPLYYDKDKEETEQTGEFSIREAYARERRKTSPITGFYSDSDERKEARKTSRYKRAAFLMAMFFMIYLSFGLDIPIVFTGPVFFITLVMFIREVNKY